MTFRLLAKTVMVAALALAYSLSGPRAAGAFQGSGCGMPIVGHNLECEYPGEWFFWCLFECGCVGVSYECSWCNDSDDCWLSCGCYAQ
jgi:hypothetical protein